MRDRLLIPMGLMLYALGAIAWAWTNLPGLRNASLAGWPLVVVQGAAGHFVAASAFLLQAQLGAWLLSGLGWNHSVVLRGLFERFLFSWVIGFVLTTLAAMLLAPAGLLNGWSIAMGAGAIALVAGYRGRSVVRRWLAHWGEGEAPSTPAMAGGIALLAGAAFWAWPLLVQTLLPNSDWDSALYHLPLAARQLEGVLWSSDPLYSSYSFPGAVSLLYACFMAVGYESAIIPFNFLAALLTVGAVFRIATRLGGRAAGVWGALLLVTTHIFWQLGVDPRIDGLLCLFIAAGLLALVGWLDAREEPAFLFLLALCLNAALGTKYTALFFAAGMSAVALLALFLLPSSRRAAERPKARVSSPRRAAERPEVGASSPKEPRTVGRILVIYLALLVVPNGFWYASNVVLHADPVFPMLRGDYYHDPDPPVAAHREREDSGDEERAGQLAALGLYALGLLFYAALASQTNVLRYALPVLPALAAGGGVVIASIGHAKGRGAARSPRILAAKGREAARSPRILAVAWRAAWILGIAMLLLQNHRAEVEKLQLLEPGLYAALDADRLRWLQTVGYNTVPAMPIVTERINREIASGRMSRDDLILMVGEGKSRLLDCRSLPDSGWFRQRWLVELSLADFDHAAVLRSLRDQGVTHILYNRDYYDWVIAYTDTPPSTLAVGSVHLEHFLRRRGERVFRVAGMELVAIERSE